MGIFDAYQIPKFHISSPSFLPLIKSRIEYAIKFLGKVDYEGTKISNTIRVELVQYFKIILRSLNKGNWQSKKLIGLIDSITVGNMREGLEYFNSFLFSGNTNVDEILSINKKLNSYQISYHQFVKSIMLGEYRYYQQDKSKIFNIFDFDTSLSNTRYLNYKILCYLNNNLNKKSDAGRGYINLGDLYFVASKIFLSQEAINDSLLRMVEYGLVNLDTQIEKNT